MDSKDLGHESSQQGHDLPKRAQSEYHQGIFMGLDTI